MDLCTRAGGSPPQSNWPIKRAMPSSAWASRIFSVSRSAEPISSAPSRRRAASNVGWSVPSLDARGHRREPAQRRFGRRPLFRGGQQKRQAGVCPQRRGLEDEIELAHERVVEPVQACCGEAHVVL